MLELKNICKTFNPGTINAKTALNDLSLTLADGDFVTVIGGNGAGKSTMLNAIAGVFPVDSRLHPHRRAGRHQAARAQARRAARARVPGPDDGHRPDHA